MISITVFTNLRITKTSMYRRAKLLHINAAVFCTAIYHVYIPDILRIFIICPVFGFLEDSVNCVLGNSPCHFVKFGDYVLVAL